ncbi:MAG: DMT family transporter [Deltaproteobacteria bacterium]|nr:DMT family transporter [Deltaproteobacteria bacterium]
MSVPYIRTKENQVLDLTAMAILLVLCVSWGLQQVAIKVANRGISPLFQAGIRSVGATAFIWIWMAVRRETMMERDGTLWWGITAGLLFSAEFILIYWGLDYIHASRAVIFLYMSPFVVALGAQLFIPGEHTFGRFKWWGCAAPLWGLSWCSESR